MSGGVSFAVETGVGENHGRFSDEEGKPQDVCGSSSSCVSPRCALNERVGLCSWMKALRRGFCRARSSAWHVMDLVIGLSGHVGSLGHLQLTIQPSLFVCEKTQITRNNKRVAD